LDERLNDLEDKFNIWRRDENAGRAPFVTAAIRFIEFERNHFADEDEHLFPVALKMLSEAEIDAAGTAVEESPGSDAFPLLDPSQQVA
jgi:hemerythrin-like domain-containing protein